MVTTTINFQTKPRTFSNKWLDVKKAKWHKYGELNSKISDVHFNFQDETDNCEKLYTSFFLLQNNIYLRVNVQNISIFGQVSWQEREIARKKAELSKGPNDVYTWKEKAALVKRETV
jgi:hypothetical protein